MFAVQDVSAEKITGTFSVGAEANIGNSGLPGTRLMTFTANGNTYNAYCAWYERGTPQPGTITLTPISKVSAAQTGVLSNRDKISPHTNCFALFIRLPLYQLNPHFMYTALPDIAI